VSVANIKEWFIGYDFDCWIEIDAEGVGIGLVELLNYELDTFTKVVLPVPDMPITIMQKLLLLVISTIIIKMKRIPYKSDYTTLCLAKKAKI
jgi:hypothetical protein